MKRKILTVLFTMMAAFVCVFAFIACGDISYDNGGHGGGTTSGNSFNGTYYYYANNECDNSDYIAINGNQWTSDDDDVYGTIETNGTSITFYINVEGVNIEFLRGTINNGIIKMHGMGERECYCMEDVTPPYYSDETKLEFTVTFDANGGTCQVTTQSYEYGAVMSNLPTPIYRGYVFLGWQDALGKKYDSTSVMPPYGFTLYAKWEKKVSEYVDNYVSFKPATEGKKHDGIFYTGSAFDVVDKYVYVEITSDDLGGVNKVGTSNNFTLRTMEGMEYSIKSGYSWNWYQGNWATPNGAQRFNLNYGSNLQFVAITDGSGVNVCNYLVDIYVKHDYYISLYTDLVAMTPYNRVRVIENEQFDATTPVRQIKGFEYDKRVYLNTLTGQYESFVYSTVIQKNWDLYQTYKPITMMTDLDDGTLNEPIAITPYVRSINLPVASKTGYDFIGWEFAEKRTDKCFSDATGSTGLNYLNGDNNGYTLKAHWEKKRFYHYMDGDTLKTETVVPTVIYDNEQWQNIEAIRYYAETDSGLEELTDDNTFFMANSILFNLSKRKAIHGLVGTAVIRNYRKKKVIRLFY